MPMSRIDFSTTKYIASTFKAFRKGFSATWLSDGDRKKQDTYVQISYEQIRFL